MKKIIYFGFTLMVFIVCMFGIEVQADDSSETYETNSIIDSIYTEDLIIMLLRDISAHNFEDYNDYDSIFDYFDNNNIFNCILNKNDLVNSLFNVYLKLEFIPSNYLDNYMLELLMSYEAIVLNYSEYEYDYAQYIIKERLLKKGAVNDYIFKFDVFELSLLAQGISYESELVLYLNSDDNSNIVYLPTGEELGITNNNEDYESDTQINSHNEIISVCPNVTLLYPASKRYNCHSFAWYSQDGDNNNLVLGNPEKYITSGMYIQGDSKPGEKVCLMLQHRYYIHSMIIISNPNNINLDVFEIGQNLTSSVLEVLDTVVVMSKWNFEGAYIHTISDYLKFYGLCGESFKTFKPNVVEEIVIDSSEQECSVNTSFQNSNYEQYKINISESSLYSFIINVEDVFFKLYDVHMCLIDEASIVNGSDFVIKNLEIGTYYIILRKDENFEQINVNFKIVRPTSNEGLLIDPAFNSMCGSEINVLEKNLSEEEKSYNSNSITEGFTRLLFLEDFSSRLDYYFISSNEDIAMVTQYGTVLAKNVDSQETVTIYAVNKNDFSNVHSIDIIVNPSVGNMTVIELEMSMHLSETKVIELGNDVPFNYLQYYTWGVNGPEICTVTQYGEIIPISEGNVYILGYYMYNENVLVVIDLTIHD